MVTLKTSRKVALLIETSNAYSRGILKGIVSYAREHGAWSIYLSEHTRGDRPPKWLSTWEGDGIIARVENGAIAKGLKGVKAPMVDVSAARLLPGLPWFETDDRAIAQLAAEHLMERGFKSFGFAGDDRFNWSKWRCEHFVDLLKARKQCCSVFDAGKTIGEIRRSEKLEAWIKGLPKPAGIMACYDFMGQQVLDACRRMKMAVPDEVAVIGVDNDELMCELSDPPLSSVAPNAQRTGYEAARLLDELMEGKKSKSETHLMAPSGVVTRQSTDVLAIEDVNVGRAIHFIRKHGCEGINVNDVVQAVPQSRRLLEKKFQKLLGRTPHEEILRVQINRVKGLLMETDLPLEQVAEKSGFLHSEYMGVVFKREVGMPPGKFRTANRHGLLGK